MWPILLASKTEHFFERPEDLPGTLKQNSLAVGRRVRLEKGAGAFEAKRDRIVVRGSQSQVLEVQHREPALRRAHQVVHVKIPMSWDGIATEARIGGFPGEPRGHSIPPLRQRFREWLAASPFEGP